jgi:BioD-like phosphotransacetylase family protein
VSEVKALADKNQVVLVEGSNALSSGDGRRLAEALDAKVLAVVRHRHTLDATALGSWPAMHGDRLLGFLFNQRGRYLDTEVKISLLPSLASAKLKSFGVIPEDRALLAVTVGQIADHLGGRFVTDENNLDGLVEYFMVGGWTLDEGRLYFETRQNKAAIMRGDRPDIQMAALSTPTVAMVCTQGLEPIEYVKYEAQEEGAAVMVVPTGTVATMEALNTLQEKAGFGHPAKLRRFTELLERHADVKGLVAALGVA